MKKMDRRRRLKQKERMPPPQEENRKIMPKLATKMEVKPGRQPARITRRKEARSITKRTDRVNQVTLRIWRFRQWEKG